MGLMRLPVLLSLRDGFGLGDHRLVEPLGVPALGLAVQEPGRVGRHAGIISRNRAVAIGKLGSQDQPDLMTNYSG